MNKLSVVIITFNEEKNIERCLKSVLKVADEIIVVDSFSTDNTREICLMYGVNFVERKWEGYSTAKNFANSIATNNYILSIDADEALSVELINSILIQKKNGFNGKYRLNRRTNYCGHWVKYCGWYPDSRVRLWDKNTACWEGELHEKLYFNESESEHFLTGDLLHYSFHTIEQHIDTIQKFSSISANQRYKKGRKSGVIRMVFKPFFKFISLYFFRLGFLDGYFGFIICINSSFSAFLKEIKLNQLHHDNHS